MELNEFRLRFLLQPLTRRHKLSVPTFAPPKAARQRKAAVLIAFMEQQGELQLILTQRALHLRAHPGQISFPGGKIEEQDKDQVATALREAEEEIGLRPDNIEVLGVFPPHDTFTGFEITPVVGLVKAQFEPKLDPGEVSECFTVPLKYLLNPRHRHSHSFLRHGRPHSVYFIPYRQRFIWGATAAMIELLCKQLSGADLLPMPQTSTQAQTRSLDHETDVNPGGE
jgi:8-oxo-dGTP pyrophosphatase MutT (NUDIX family)